MYSRGLFFFLRTGTNPRAREREMPGGYCASTCEHRWAWASSSAFFFFFGGDRRGLPIGRNAKATACLRDVGAMEDDAHAGREWRVWWEVLLAQVRKVSSSSGLQMIRVPQDASLLAKMHALNAFPLA